jgi:putative ABC transport system permease protein
VSVDGGDLRKLGLPRAPIGAQLELADRQVTVAAVTEGIRSFTLSPYLFTSPATARRLLGLGDGQAMYWALDLRDPTCVDSVVTWVERHPDLKAVRTDAWMSMTEDYWVGGSGAGMAIAFSALLGWIVGAVIVGQTLYSLTRDHLRELATLKAIGAHPAELLGFVGWQAAFLAIVGGSIGIALALVAQRAAAPAGLSVVLSSSAFVIGVGSVIVMCLIASVSSARVVLRLEAAEVFK